ncbi:hypothetical protein MTQ17_09880 [Corynebacterium bovis]|uniref:hypothetical protein n=1 Tax=Corynebacterium bovis TaxID=36808 RepID=UPI003138FEC8
MSIENIPTNNRTAPCTRLLEGKCQLQAQFSDVGGRPTGLNKVLDMCSGVISSIGFICLAIGLVCLVSAVRIAVNEKYFRYGVVEQKGKVGVLAAGGMVAVAIFVFLVIIL